MTAIGQILMAANNAAERGRREKVRLAAAEMIEAGASDPFGNFQN